MPESVVLVERDEWDLFTDLVGKVEALAKASKDGSVKGALVIKDKDSPSYKLAVFLKEIVEAFDALPPGLNLV